MTDTYGHPGVWFGYNLINIGFDANHPSFSLSKLTLEVRSAEIELLSESGDWLSSAKAHSISVFCVKIMATYLDDLSESEGHHFWHRQLPAPLKDYVVVNVYNFC